MYGKICAFCGHRDVFDPNVKKRAEKEIISLIEQGFTTFYSGGMGDFDKICEGIVCGIKRKNDKIKLCLVLPYMKSSINHDRAYYNSLYDEIVVPDLGDIHYKRAITARNRWLVENSDMILAYVFREIGGAWTMFKHAEKSGVKYVNVYEKKI